MTDRLECIQTLMPAVRTVVFDYLNQPKETPADSEEARDLAKALGYIETDIATLESDADALEFERFRLRPLLHQIQTILQREHATLAKPFLGWSKIVPDANAVFFCGAVGTRDLLLQVCSERKLRLIDVAANRATAVDRWNSLRSARIAVFDLSCRDKALRASVFHELGQSMALGQHAVVLASLGDPIPFNVDIQPVRLSSTSADLASLGTAIDRALFSLMRPSGGSSFEATLKKLERHVTTPTAAEKVLIEQLRSVKACRTEALALVNQILIARRDDGLALFFPRWPGDYPDEDGLCCFHITPFAEEFLMAHTAVKKSCIRAGVAYRKGDQGPLLDILHSIWLLTCRADCVVADLTGLNDNVCVEVGIALALGRPILLTARIDKEAALELYPDIEKMQVHPYRGPDELAQLVTDFLNTTTRSL